MFVDTGNFLKHNHFFPFYKKVTNVVTKVLSTSVETNIETLYQRHQRKSPPLIRDFEIHANCVLFRDPKTGNGLQLGA